MGAIDIYRPCKHGACSGFSLMELMLVISLITLVHVLTLQLLMQLHHFKHDIERISVKRQQELLVHYWLQQAYRKAGFLGCQSNTPFFRQQQTPSVQQFLATHLPVTEYDKQYNVWQPPLPNYLQAYENKTMHISEVQYFKSLPIAPRKQAEHIWTFTLNEKILHNRVVLADCAHFKILRTHDLLQMNQAQLQWHDDYPLLDSHFTRLGVWQRVAYFKSIDGAHFFRKVCGKELAALL